MKVGLRYSRKDVCKMLGFDSNQESTIYGYKVDKTTKTCPIFVTYKKDEDISASTKYGDRSERVLHWFTRSKVKLTSEETQDILSGDAQLYDYLRASSNTSALVQA
ncbi:DUF3427 domain-containing protein [Arcanobacterium haemolyticum]|uniref:DUF3427 domain-containing protein n=1 Tax=Arcanobacterium haemolyticum TaxID=28264 RepID=UPI0011108914|nr:DUF3427 domain-containing protein [Arcanobacterium haemolyticum]